MGVGYVTYCVKLSKETRGTPRKVVKKFFPPFFPVPTDPGGRSFTQENSRKRRKLFAFELKCISQAGQENRIS